MRQLMIVSGQRLQRLPSLDIPQNCRPIPAGRNDLIAARQPIGRHHHRRMRTRSGELAQRRPQHIHTTRRTINPVVLVLVQLFLRGMALPRRRLILDGRLPNMRGRITARCEHQILGRMKPDRVHRSLMALVLQQTSAALDAPNGGRVIGGRRSDNRLADFRRHLPDAVLVIVVLLGHRTDHRLALEAGHDATRLGAQFVAGLHLIAGGAQFRFQTLVGREEIRVEGLGRRVSIGITAVSLASGYGFQLLLY